VHWIGKSVPCPGDGCPLCDTLPARGVFYMPGLCCGVVSLCEFSVQSANHLEQHCGLLHGGMRAGLIVKLRRSSAKSSIYTEVMGAMPSASEVPLLTVAARVMALYQLPGPNPNESIEQYETRISTLSLRRCEAIYKTCLKSGSLLGTRQA